MTITRSTCGALIAPNLENSPTEMPVSISGNDTGGTANTDSIFIFSECLLGLFARIGERLFPNVTLNFLLLSETTFNSGKFYASYIDQIVNKLGKCCQVAQLDLERPGDLETDKLATFIGLLVAFVELWF